MSSTGEVASYAPDFHQAFLKSLMSAGFRIPKKAILVAIPDNMTAEFAPVAKKLKNLGLELYVAGNAAESLGGIGIESKRVPSKDDVTKTDVSRLIRNKTVDLVINLAGTKSDMAEDNHVMRRCAIDNNVPLLTNFQVVSCLADALEATKGSKLDVSTLFHFRKTTADLVSGKECSESKLKMKSD